MARVDNLSRRGDRYHWRVRVPARLRASRSHIALALNTADRSVAERWAQRLNQVLAEMHQLTPDSAALENIFRSELQSMQDWHASGMSLTERLSPRRQALAAFRSYQVGWAWRLVERFGSVNLKFQGDCPALAYLRAKDVDEEFIVGVAREYGEIAATATSPFLEIELNERLALLGCPETAQARLALSATTDLARIIAAESILADHRILERMQHLGAAEEERDIERPTVASAKQGEVASKIGVDVSANRPASSAGSTDGWQVRRGAAAIPSGKNLAVSDLLSEAETLCKLRSKGRKSWAPKTQKQVLQVIRMWQALLIEEGVAATADIAQTHVAALRILMMDVARHYGQGLQPNKPFPPPSVLRRRAKIAQASGRPVGLDPSTVRRHYGFLQAFLRHLKAYGFAIAEFTFEELVPPKKTKLQQRQATVKFPTEKFAPFFQLPMFAGCKSAEEMDVPGSTFVHCGQTLVPLILLCSGARRNEISNLDTDDVIVSGGLPCFHIRFTEDRRLKTEMSERIVPIPSELLRLKFMNYVEAIKALGHRKLFPDLFTEAKNDPGDKLYDLTMQHIKNSQNLALHKDFKPWDRFFHSFRHSINNFLAGIVKDSVRYDLLGHTPDLVSDVNYRNPVAPRIMLKAMRKIPIITGHIEARGICLLPIVISKC